MERQATPQEKRVRFVVAMSVLGFAVLIVLVLYGAMWYRYMAFRSYVAEMGDTLKAGRLSDACRFVCFKDRDKATAAARWAEVSGHKNVIEDLHILRAQKTPGIQEWETDLKFRIADSSYPNVFIRATWKKEDGKWCMDFDRTFEYMPIDNTTRSSLTSLLEYYSGLDLDKYEGSSPPPDY